MTDRSRKRDEDLPPGVFRRGDRYRVIVYAGIDPVTGKQRRVTGTADTPREAVKLRARLLTEIGQGKHKGGGKLTVAELLERYIRQLEAAEKSPSTIDRVRSAAKTINPRIGRLEVTKLDEDALNDLYDYLKAHGRKCQLCWSRLRKDLPALREGERYTMPRPARRRRCGAPLRSGGTCRKWTRYQSGRCERHGGAPERLEPDRTHRGDCVAGQPMAAGSVLRIHGILSAALAGAPRKLLDHNPAHGANTPRVRKSEVRPPEHGDVARLLAAAAEVDPEWAVWLRLDAMTGARRGELCAIRINKIDWKTGEVRMDRGIIHAKDARGHDQLVDRPTKAGTAKRPVLDPETLRLVKELVRRKKEDALRCGVRLARDAYLFSQDPAGRKPVRPQLMTKRFMRARDRLGLEGVRLHDMRHWAATSMLGAGIPVQIAAGRLGNDPRTMLRVYSHFLPGSDRVAGELLAGLVDGPGPPEVDGRAED